MRWWETTKQRGKESTHAQSVQYQTAAHDSSFWSFFEGADCSFLSNKRRHSILYHCAETLLAKDQKKNYRASCYLKITFDRLSLSTKHCSKSADFFDRDFKRIRKNAGNYLFPSLIWNFLACMLGRRPEGKYEKESIFLLLVEIKQSSWHNLSLWPVPCSQKGTDSYETSRFDLVFLLCKLWLCNMSLWR